MGGGEGESHTERATQRAYSHEASPAAAAAGCGPPDLLGPRPVVRPR